MDEEVSYVVVSELARGQMGIVAKVKSSVSKDVYAAKFSLSHHKKVLQNESDIHSRLVHPNIIQFITSFETVCPLGTIIEPLPGGPCGVVLLELCDSPVGVLKGDMVEIRKFTKQMVSALNYLYEQDIMHTDIKPPNILKCGELYKLADFGLARVVSKMAKPTAVVGTIHYLPPESIYLRYGFETDVWSLGVTIFQVAFGSLPWHGTTYPVWKKAILKEPPAIPPNADPELSDLITKMLTVRYQDRISVQDILKHPFLDYDAVDPQFESFKKHKIDFGDGSRDAFYLYLANKNPNKTPMSMATFTNLWDRL